MTTQFALPDVGEGLTEADIVSWRVAAGDTVTMNQVLVEIETAKSLVELPSPHQGRIGTLLVAEGDTVAVGTPIIEFAAKDSPAAAPEGRPQNPGTPPAPSAGDGESGATLVGYGAAGAAGGRRRRLRSAPARTLATAIAPEAGHAAEGVPTAPALAKPPVRKLAKDWGIDLRAVAGTGPAGVVTRGDLERHRDGLRDGGLRGGGPQGTVRPDTASRETRIPVKGVRKATAKAMVASAFTAPHVTEFLDVDVTATMDYLVRAKAEQSFGEGIKVSPLAVLAKAVCWALARTPEMNASLDGDEIVVKDYVNLGIAAATDRGLIVPNIKDAQKLGLAQLAGAITELAGTARAGTTTPAAQAGGTITITNVGMFGVDAGTPIINPGECAIIAFGQIAKKPWVVGDELAVRHVTTLSVSADHRIVDGAAISTFLADIGRALNEPMRMLS